MTLYIGLAVAGGLLLAFIMLINAIVVASAKKLQNAESLLDVIENGPAILSGGGAYTTRARWAEDHGFVPDLVADFHGAVGGTVIVIGVWRNRATRTYFSSYTVPGKECCEFITMLERDSGLTTTNTIDSVMIPNAEGRYVQAFAGMSISELHRRHEEGLAWLHQHKMLDAVERSESTPALILESISRQMAHVRTLPLWQLRGAWWYFVRRRMLNNKSVAAQCRDEV